MKPDQFDHKAHDSRLIGPEEMELRWATDVIEEARRTWASSVSETSRIGSCLEYAKAQAIRKRHRLSLVADKGQLGDTGDDIAGYHGKLVSRGA